MLAPTPRSTLRHRVRWPAVEVLEMIQGAMLLDELLNLLLSDATFEA